MTHCPGQCRQLQKRSGTDPFAAPGCSDLLPHHLTMLNLVCHAIGGSLPFFCIALCKVIITEADSHKEKPWVPLGISSKVWQQVYIQNKQPNSKKSPPPLYTPPHHLPSRLRHNKIYFSVFVTFRLLPFLVLHVFL